MKHIYKEYTGPVQTGSVSSGFFQFPFPWNGRTATESPVFSGLVWSQSGFFLVLWTGLLIPSLSAVSSSFSDPLHSRPCSSSGAYWLFHPHWMTGIYERWGDFGWTEFGEAWW